MLLIITSTGDEVLRNVNIDDLEPPKSGVLVSEFFAISRCDTLNCVAVAGDRPKQPAYEIFGIKFNVDLAV